MVSELGDWFEGLVHNAFSSFEKGVFYRILSLFAVHHM